MVFGAEFTVGKGSVEAAVEKIFEFFNQFQIFLMFLQFVFLTCGADECTVEEFVNVFINSSTVCLGEFRCSRQDPEKFARLSTIKVLASESDGVLEVVGSQDIVVGLISLCVRNGCVNCFFNSNK